MRALVLALLLAGCMSEAGRYQIVSNANTTWRIDTRTGEMEACGFEAGKPVCHSFPAPKK
jgi:hypothetical protein